MLLKLSRGVRVWLAAALLLPATAVLTASNWPEWRGPARTGASSETGLPDSWSPEGENLAWKVPIGGRSAPVVFGDHLYLQTSVGAGATLQERIICFNADTGKQLWEHRYNLFTSDAPPSRIGWASPAVDPATGNVFAISSGGLLMSLSSDGKLLWERSLAEEFGMWTTHGGRMSSPVVDGGQVIVSGLTFMWGGSSNGAHRFLSFDKSSGHTIYVSAPEGRPTDTIYANPYIANVNGVRMFFSGGSDGAMHGLKVNTGEKIWSYKVSQRGLNTAALGVGSDMIVTHSEENVGTSQMGMVAAVPMASKGDLTDKDARWFIRGIQAGYASPVTDGERVYVLDNGGVLFAIDLKTGKQLWHESLGTIAKASPVYADGKLYIGTENTGDAGGKFFIIRPAAAKPEILDQDWLGTSEQSELIIGSPIVARGRIYVISTNALYAIGPKGTQKPATTPAPASTPLAPAGPATVAFVTPAELILKPGESIALNVKLFDANGNPARPGGTPTWELEGLKGTIAGGKFTSDKAAGAQAGLVKATIDGVTGASRIRVIPDLPWTFDFEAADQVPAHWINATGKFEVRDVDPTSAEAPASAKATADKTAGKNNKVLVKLAENPFAFAKRTRPFFGPPDLSNYTIEAEVRSKDIRRVMADVGIVAQRYELVLFGNHQRLELQPWQPEIQRTVKKPFTWAKDTWYVMKLEVQTLDASNVRARGKVWPKGEQEPAEWTIERVDPIGSLKGSPGIYADVPNADPRGGSEIYYDNIRVYPNGK